MITRLYTDFELNALRTMPKRVTNPGARWLKKPKRKPGHRQRTFRAAAVEENNRAFLIFQRQGLLDEFDFSCGLVCIFHRERLVLARYNGPGHEHGDIAFRPHIHCATEQAIADGLQPDSHAKETDRFDSLNGALACLISDCAVTGLPAPLNQRPLF